MSTRANWSPLIPDNDGNFGHYGCSGILRGAGVVFFAFIGFDAVSNARPGGAPAAEGHADRHPGLAGRLTILYVLVAGRPDRAGAL